ncbi:MAG: cytidylyltransferase, partial [Promethearchaeota archaeon CR_4]
KGVKQAFLGNEGSELTEKVAELQPDIVALGPNQKFDEDKLVQKLREKGLNVQVVRITQFLNNIPLHSSSSIKNKIKNGNT